jgi:protein-tyrosine phosphatase
MIINPARLTALQTFEHNNSSTANPIEADLKNHLASTGNTPRMLAAVVSGSPSYQLPQPSKPYSSKHGAILEYKPATPKAPGIFNINTDFSDKNAVTYQLHSSLAEPARYPDRHHPSSLPIDCNPANSWTEGLGAFQEMYVQKQSLVHSETPVSFISIDGVDLYISSLPIDHNSLELKKTRKDVVRSDELLSLAAMNRNLIVNLYGDSQETPYLQELRNTGSHLKPDATGNGLPLQNFLSEKQAVGTLSTAHIKMENTDRAVRPVEILHDLAWPDYGTIPLSGLIELIISINNRLEKSSTASEPSRQTPSPLIHCLAGAGRSGTVAAAYIMSQRADHIKSLLPAEAMNYLHHIVSELKHQRSSLLVEVVPQMQLLVNYLHHLRGDMSFTDE